MIILRNRLFSGYSEASPQGSSYHPAQVMTDYALDPLEKSVNWVDNTKLGEIEPVKKKTKLVKDITSSLKILLKRKPREEKKNKPNKKHK